MAIVDASVYVALVHENEPGHDVSWQWLEGVQQRGEALRAPALLASEVAAAIARGTNNSELAHQIAVQVMTFNVVELVPVTLQIAGRAAVIAAEHRLRGCDAVYVALAEQLDDHLVTLDRQQLERGAPLARTRQPGPHDTSDIH